MWKTNANPSDTGDDTTQTANAGAGWDDTGNSDNQNPNTQDQQDGTQNNKQNNDQGQANQDMQIPKYRFDEVSQENKRLKADLAERDAQEEQRKQEALKKQGKYKELHEQSQSRIQELEGKETEITAMNDELKKVITSRTDKLKTQVGEEKYTKITQMVGFETKSPLEQLKTLDAMESLAEDLNPSGQGGHKIQSHWGQGSGGDQSKEEKLKQAQANGSFEEFTNALFAQES